MAATLAYGLANVATLARQKFQSSAGATSTAGALGGGGSVVVTIEVLTLI